MWKFRANSPAGWKRRVVLCLSLLLVCAAPLLSGMPRAERHEKRHEIDQLEEAWRNAVLRRDADTMNSLLSDDYIGITPMGTLLSKEQTLSNLRTGGMHLTAIGISDRKVRFYGTTAVVTCSAQVIGATTDGVRSGGYRYTHVWVKDGHGAWKIVSFEASRIRARKGDQSRGGGKQ